MLQGKLLNYHESKNKLDKIFAVWLSWKLCIQTLSAWFGDLETWSTTKFNKEPDIVFLGGFHKQSKELNKARVWLQVYGNDLATKIGSKSLRCDHAFFTSRVSSHCRVFTFSWTSRCHFLGHSSTAPSWTWRFCLPWSELQPSTPAEPWNPSFLCTRTCILLKSELGFKNNTV